MLKKLDKNRIFKIRLLTTADIILLLFIIIFSIVLLINPTVKSVNVTINGITHTYSFTLMDVLKNYFTPYIFTSYTIMYMGGGSEYEEIFRDLTYTFYNITNDTIFRTFLVKYTTKHNYLQFCISLENDTYSCNLYLLRRYSVEPVPTVKSDVPTLFFSNKAIFYVFLENLKNRNYHRALEVLVDGYKRDNVMFVNIKVWDFLEYWSSS